MQSFNKQSITGAAAGVNQSSAGSIFGESVLARINRLTPQVIDAVGDVSTSFSPQSFLSLGTGVTVHWLKGKMSVPRDIVVPAGLAHRRFPSYYLKPYHGQPCGYLNPVSAVIYDPIICMMYGKARLWNMQYVAARALGAALGSGPILDLGSGTGSLFKALRAAHPRAQIHGIELSPYMIETGKRTTLLDMDKADLIEGCVTKLPYPDESMRGVTASFLFHEMPVNTTRETLAEAYRVLAPGGRLVILDTVLDGTMTPSVHHALYCASTYEPYAAEFSQMNVEGALRDAGFSSVETRPRVYGAVGLRIATKATSPKPGGVYLHRTSTDAALSLSRTNRPRRESHGI
ncbi:class I SAM-dependent methyltransferase [Sorangium sp. So ce269]